MEIKKTSVLYIVIGILVIVSLSLFLTSKKGITGQVVAEVDTQSITESLSNSENLFDLILSGFDYRPTDPHMANHMYKKVDTDGEFVFLHFDKPIGQAAKVWYTGNGVPGKFCKEDQNEVEKKYGDGFTHFHKKKVNKDGATPEDGHGGLGGEEGFWFRHVALAEFDMPWGQVLPGVDYNFMPTPPPECNA